MPPDSNVIGSNRSTCSGPVVFFTLVVKSKMVPKTQALPGIGVLQPTPMPVPTQMPLTFMVVPGSHCTAETHLPPTMTTLPPSTSQGVSASGESTATHLSVPSDCCFCVVPGPQLGALQL